MENENKMYGYYISFEYAREVLILIFLELMQVLFLEVQI